MDFVFRDGIGIGTFTNSFYSFRGGIKEIAFEMDVCHCHCAFTFINGLVEERIFDTGVLQSMNGYNLKEGSNQNLKGEFELDEQGAHQLVNGEYSERNKWSSVKIKVNNRIGSGI